MVALTKQLHHQKLGDLWLRVLQGERGAPSDTGNHPSSPPSMIDSPPKLANLRRNPHMSPKGERISALGDKNSWEYGHCMEI